MARMTAEQAEHFLHQAHVGVLSVSRADRGPVAVPIWYEYDDGAVWMVTLPGSVHGRILQRTGRATLTVHAESYGESRTEERYVIVEGPIEITDEDIEPRVRRIRSHYYTGARAREWVERPLDDFTRTQRVTVLRPERLSGFEWIENL